MNGYIPEILSGMQVEDYLHVILTDEEDVPEAMGKLRTIYPNLLKLSYDNLRTQSTGEIWGRSGLRRRPPWPFSQDLYPAAEQSADAPKFRRNF